MAGATKKTASKTAAKKAAQVSQTTTLTEVEEARTAKVPTRKEQLAADHPVQRSGLTSVTHDELNPAFKLNTK